MTTTRGNKRAVSAFTLIELLIVVGIIGIMAGFSALVLKPGEFAARGRDSKRQADLEAVASVLALYKVDQSAKTYPVAGAVPTSWAGLGAVLSGYTDQWPVDPKSGWSYGYCVNDAATPRGFRLEACYESSDAAVAGTKMSTTGGTSPPADCTSNGFAAVCP